MAKKILVVDDEPNIVELITFNLKQNGYETVIARDGRQAWERFIETKPDLVLLDIMMTETDGLELCKNIRAQSDVPVIMISARIEEFDKVLALEIGADDYMTKPFSVRELLARVKAQLRRSAVGEKREESVSDDQIVFDRLTMVPSQHQVRKDEKELPLTLTEYRILEMLMRHPGRVMSREMLIEHVLGTDFYGDTRTIDVHVRHLREKIEDEPGTPRYLLTVRGVGYKFRDRP